MGHRAVTQFVAKRQQIAKCLSSLVLQVDLKPVAAKIGRGRLLPDEPSPAPCARLFDARDCPIHARMIIHSCGHAPGTAVDPVFSQESACIKKATRNASF
jgi:hypothetical protein